MDSSKILEGTGECSSTESGWTTYIASPVDEHDHTDYDDDDDDDNGSLGEKAYKKVAQEDVDNVDSDDSMASDASSGPSDQGHLLGRSCGFGHAGNRALLLLHAPDARSYCNLKQVINTRLHRQLDNGHFLHYIYTSPCEVSRSGNKNVCVIWRARHYYKALRRQIA